MIIVAEANQLTIVVLTITIGMTFGMGYLGLSKGAWQRPLGFYIPGFATAIFIVLLVALENAIPSLPSVSMGVPLL